MAQTKVSGLPSVAVIQDTDLFLLTVDIGGGLFQSRKISKLALVTALGFPPSWGLTGNSGTNPATNFLGTTDAIDLTLKTNSAPRIWMLSNGNITIGTATSNSANIHFKGVNTLFQTHATPSGISANKQLNFDSSVTAPSAAFVTADLGSWTLYHRTPTNINGGAMIRLGNDNANTNQNGISFLTGTATESTPTNRYAMHLTDIGDCIITNKNIFTVLPGAAVRAKLHVFTKGNGAGTVGMIIRNTDNIETFKVWDHQRIVTNRSSVLNYSPVAALDFYTTLLTGSIFMQMESGSGIMWEQLCNGNVVMGRGISTGSKLGIKGDGNAFVGNPTHALHVKGDIRFDGQSSGSAGAATGTYLIINIDGVARKIQLFNT